MADIKAELAALMQQVDDATNAIATRIDDLIKQLQAGTLTVAELDAAVQPELDKLKALGAPPPVAG